MTIKDIARISGCSVSTISRVINDRPDVRPETKEHVLKVMREAGFTWWLSFVAAKLVPAKPPKLEKTTDSDSTGTYCHAS